MSVFTFYHHDFYFLLLGNFSSLCLSFLFSHTVLQVIEFIVAGIITWMLISDINWKRKSKRDLEKYQTQSVLYLMMKNSDGMLLYMLHLFNHMIFKMGCHLICCLLNESPIQYLNLILKLYRYYTSYEPEAQSTTCLYLSTINSIINMIL